MARSRQYNYPSTSLHLSLAAILKNGGQTKQQSNRKKKKKKGEGEEEEEER
jgi:hypothetical protein